MVIPASGKNVRVSFLVDGAIHTDPGASVSIALTANGQLAVSHSSEGMSSEPFNIAQPFRAKSVDEIGLAVILAAQRDSDLREVSALIVINTLGADAAL